ncbi:uncharacterized protein LOC114840927 isoform X2 [Esox lucius]|uniref:uncharacterized protein LOC114840927 isoform X2 n=1 Tax=Esox lucius TaxID=8010 RepID=UPI0014771C91|nr:uncharacterized protein LOC114840927 isoform X2 [Esox lucius]
MSRQTVNIQFCFLLVCLFLKTAFLQVTCELKFQIVKPVSLVGEEVQMTCDGPCSSFNYTWCHLNETKYTGSIYILHVTLENSGEYKCSCYINGNVCYSKAVNLTVVERLSKVWVSSTALAIVEGQSLTLHCEAASQPSSVAWTWTRLNESGGWSAVSAEQELTLTRAGQSGQYQCHAYSNVLGLTQSQNSSVHSVYIISFPLTGSVNAGVAGLGLALLALVSLLLLMMWRGRQLANESLAAGGTLAKGLAGPTKAQKGRQCQGQTGDTGEIYMNCGRITQTCHQLT